MSSFEAGLKFHSLVDEAGENFMHSNNFYSFVPKSPYISYALKFFADRVLYEKRNRWQEIIVYFDSFLEEEITYDGLKMADIQKWHRILQKYLAGRPNERIIREFVSSLGRSKEMADETIRLEELMESKKILKQIVIDFYSQFEDLASESLAF